MGAFLLCGELRGGVWDVNRSVSEVASGLVACESLAKLDLRYVELAVCVEGESARHEVPGLRAFDSWHVELGRACCDRPAADDALVAIPVAGSCVRHHLTLVLAEAQSMRGLLAACEAERQLGR